MSAARKALQRLREIWRILKIYGVEQYVSFDLGMISGYMYYTGIVFRGYTFGTGDAVIKGGRYDRLLEQFGTPAPAVGFVSGDRPADECAGEAEDFTAASVEPLYDYL